MIASTPRSRDRRIGVRDQPVERVPLGVLPPGRDGARGTDRRAPAAPARMPRITSVRRTRSFVSPFRICRKFSTARSPRRPVFRSLAATGFARQSPAWVSRGGRRAHGPGLLYASCVQLSARGLAATSSTPAGSSDSAVVLRLLAAVAALWSAWWRSSSSSSCCTTRPARSRRRRRRSRLPWARR